MPSGTDSIRAISGLGVPIDEVEQQSGPRPDVERPERGRQVGVGGVGPRPRLDPADRCQPAPSAAELVERQPQRDRVQPGPDVDAIEPVPRAIGLEIGVLGDVLRVMRIAEDQDQTTHQVRVVRAYGRLEGVLRVPGDGGTICARRRGHIGGGHGIGCPKHAPTPVAPTRWSTTMITWPLGSLDPGIT